MGMRNPAAAAAAQHLDPHHPHHQGKYVDLQKTQHNFLSFQQQTPREISISILFVVPTNNSDDR
jgi:hypothetical protein